MLYEYLADAAHFGGTQVPKNTTPPSERFRKVPNRAMRRKMIKQARKHKPKELK